MSEPLPPHPSDDFGDFFDGTGPVPGDLRRMVDALTAPAVVDVGVRHSVVMRMAETLASTTPQPGGLPVIGRRSRRIAVLATAGTLLFGGAAAAAGGAGVLGDVFGTGDETAIEAGDETTTSGGSDTTSSDTTSSETTTGEEPTTSLDETTTTAETTTTLSPEEQACADAENHGDFVSDIAKNKDHEGNHGSVVSEAAKSDCGKKSTDDDSDDDADDDDDSDSDDDTPTTVDDEDGPGKSDEERGKSGEEHGKSGDDHGNARDNDD